MARESGRIFWKRVSLISWFFLALSFVVSGVIYAYAMFQPRIADPTYRHPRDLLGQVHFLTDLQDRVFSISEPLMGIAFIALIVSFLISERHK